eukprot:5187721-Alexandrium_andersonii.AAC.1
MSGGPGHQHVVHLHLIAGLLVDRRQVGPDQPRVGLVPALNRAVALVVGPLAPHGAPPPRRLPGASEPPAPPRRLGALARHRPATAR